ncbi:MAG: 30S ribosome-binding factor RbfA, partial [Deltaproteobacteria bacterium]|nr:30S ribosome-binding factor RbfA [Deltaproteobacteria bacterium]
RFGKIARVGERIRGELADMILRGEVRDPATQGAIVSAVSVTGDLSLARVFLRVLEAEASEARKREVVAAFDRAKGHVRRELAARVSRGSGAMRSVPELRFAWDDTTDRAARLDEVFAEVAADRATIEREQAARAATTEGADDEP